ncbi:MAG: VOC family protein [Thermodesulfobacteriota bacterium]
MLRFNHMELTLPPGTLTPEFRAEVDEFYGSVFGFRGVDTEVVGQLTHVLLTGEGQFILLAEGEKHLHSPGYDHLGFLHDTRAEVDELLARCERHRERDHRVQIKKYEDLVVGDLTVHAFYVRHLLPIWFDVQCMEQRGVAQPAWPARA